MNYKSLFQEKYSLQLNHFQFSKMNKLLSNSAICLSKFRFGKCFLMIFFVIVNLAWGQFCYGFFYVIKHIKNREGKRFGHKWEPSSMPISLFVKFKYLLTKTCN